MNSVTKYREALRNDRRKQDITKFKTNMRNLIYYNQQSSPYKCAVCEDDRWISNENVSHILQLITSIFNNKHICDQHLQVMLLVIFRCLQNEPSIYEKLLSIGNEMTRQVVIRKILFVLQLFESKEMAENERIWQEIVRSFTSKHQFIVKIMDCAYSFNEWTLLEQDQNWDIEIKGICFTTVLNIFSKYPLLFATYLDQYPINLLLERTKHYQTINILLMLRNIIRSDEQQQQFSQIKQHIYLGIKMYLSSIKHIPHTLELFAAVLTIVNDLAKVGNVDEQFQSDLLYMVQNNSKFKEETYALTLQLFQNLNSPILPQQQWESLQRIKFVKSRMQIQQSKQMQIQ